jgi:predicted transcriptional regulator of viral defense system
MATYRDRAREIALGQYGFISTDDAQDEGIPPVELAKLAARGRLRNVAYGLYRFDDIPSTPYDQFYEAVRRIGGDAHLTSDAVLAVHNLAQVNPRRIRVGTSRRFRGKTPAWLEVVREQVGPEELTVVEQVPTVTLRRAMRDAQRFVMTNRLLEAIPRAEDAGLLTEAEAAELHDELASSSA